MKTTRSERKESHEAMLVSETNFRSRVMQVLDPCTHMQETWHELIVVMPSLGGFLSLGPSYTPYKNSCHLDFIL
jgi:hypothetical protein